MTTTTPAGTARIQVTGFVNPTPAGTLPLALVSAPELGIEQAALYIDGNTNRLVLMAQCGCATHAPLDQLVQALAQMLVTEHTRQAPDMPMPNAPSSPQLQ